MQIRPLLLMLSLATLCWASLATAQDFPKGAATLGLDEARLARLDAARQSYIGDEPIGERMDDPQFDLDQAEASRLAVVYQPEEGGGTGDGVRLLSPKTIELMTTDHLNGIPFQPGNGMGLGFSVLKDPGARGTLGSVGEDGWGGAHHSSYRVDPAGRLVVVYLTQILNAGALDDFNPLLSGIYQAIIE